MRSKKAERKTNVVHVVLYFIFCFQIFLTTIMIQLEA